MPRIVQNDDEATKYVNEQVAAHKVVVFSKSYCPYCVKVSDKKLAYFELNIYIYIYIIDNLKHNLFQAKNLLKQLNANAHEIELDLMDSGKFMESIIRIINTTVSNALATAVPIRVNS